MKTYLNKNSQMPLNNCPNYNNCSVNNCPLHPKYPDLSTSKSDPEIICKLSKSKRIKIASEYPATLRFEGLTTREYSGKRNWERMNPETKDKIRSTIKKFNFKCINLDDEKKVV